VEIVNAIVGAVLSLVVLGVALYTVILARHKWHEQGATGVVPLT